MRKPQHDVPTEVIIKYIVKDYRRMFLEHEELLARAERAEAKIAEINEKRQSDASKIRKECQQRIDDIRKSRDNVINSVTEDLRSQLKNSNRRVKFLVQALDDPAILEKVSEHIITTDDDKEWMDRAMRQLEKAIQSFVPIRARLAETKEGMDGIFAQEISGGEAEKVYKRFSKVFPKIDSCVSHIEDFFAKTGNIKIK